MHNFNDKNTICALSTPHGEGAIAVLRLSGENAVDIADSFFDKDIKKKKGYTIVYGSIVKDDEVIDDVILFIFRAPHSFTGEDVVEISCHGSLYIQHEIIQMCINGGARSANPGEFSMRAFANGKMDLSQAEAVADLVASSSKAAHKLAMQQMKGGFSKEIGELRQKLIDFASMIELELDFSEEDVEFADRSELNELIETTMKKVDSLLNSFKTGNAIKNGIPVAIAGAPNVGKSTLLNQLLNEERAIVTEIPGTTRDVIEDRINLDGVEYRFIDTAGIRDTEDKVENLGIEKTFEKAKNANVVMYMMDADLGKEGVLKKIEEFKQELNEEEVSIINVVNKIDLVNGSELVEELKDRKDFAFISAKEGKGLDDLKESLKDTVDLGTLKQEIVVTNARHYEALKKSKEALEKVMNGMEMGITGDLLAQDIRYALHYLGEITGEITTDDLLGNIFSKFCIGK
ncbi:MAG: tRNA uridine-5-carboxymethylaminomethyl(34) synthesis GTPase MnmE [Flavobacteriales bacterium]